MHIVRRDEEQAADDHGDHGVPRMLVRVGIRVRQDSPHPQRAQQTHGLPLGPHIRDPQFAPRRRFQLFDRKLPSAAKQSTRVSAGGRREPPRIQSSGRRKILETVVARLGRPIERRRRPKLASRILTRKKWREREREGKRACATESARNGWGGVTWECVFEQ